MPKKEGDETLQEGTEKNEKGGGNVKGGKERSQWKKFSFVPMRGRRRENRREGREAMQ